jgi:hypothetical protein
MATRQDGYRLAAFTAEAQLFIGRLSAGERDELLGLELRWNDIRDEEDRHDHQDVTQDWIEEHGGERSVWSSIRATKA